MIEWVLGHRPSKLSEDQIHWPIIQSVTLPAVWQAASPQAWEAWQQADLLIWTSREAVRFWEQWRHEIDPLGRGPGWDRMSLKHWCVGPGTRDEVVRQGASTVCMAKTPTAEGLLLELMQQPLQEAFVGWLHAQGARPVLRRGLSSGVRRWWDLAFYDTQPRWDALPPPYGPQDQLLFTSPSCVQAWMARGWPLPPLGQVRAIGPITSETLIRQTISLS